MDLKQIVIKVKMILFGIASGQCASNRSPLMNRSEGQMMRQAELLCARWTAQCHWYYTCPASSLIDSTEEEKVRDQFVLQYRSPRLYSVLSRSVLSSVSGDDTANYGISFACTQRHWIDRKIQFTSWPRTVLFEKYTGFGGMGYGRKINPLIREKVSVIGSWNKDLQSLFTHIWQRVE